MDVVATLLKATVHKLVLLRMAKLAAEVEEHRLAAELVRVAAERQLRLGGAHELGGDGRAAHEERALVPERRGDENDGADVGEARRDARDDARPVREADEQHSLRLGQLVHHEAHGGAHVRRGGVAAAEAGAEVEAEGGEACGIAEQLGERADGGVCHRSAEGAPRVADDSGELRAPVGE
eukprot:CAMPEP_0113251660 /NCGR_PEP_ID=MMETSP0008_2-20120614/12239_1 /TAXON_ID=97485 /ORGANISM="Prymnesium parvum" /LENGTH=179 /DNA_ID=CAMNT_0000099731 /DNA_START=474 /DNA_END=1013 /DNA_ORIENTATION=+ /assembly_acc=CAM_ASM_000153